MTIWKNWLKRGEGMRIRRKWALLALLAAAVLLGAGIFGIIQYRRATWRYPYSPETRKLNYFEENFSYVYLPSMETNLRLCDSVVRGVITSNGINSNIPDYSGMEYTFEVREQIMGNETPDEITICFWGSSEGGLAKPHINDELILFLSYKPPYDVYIPTNDESSMFAIMPDDSLYPFYPNMGFALYDYKPVSDLYDWILEAAINIRENPEEYEDTPSIGAVLPGLLDSQSDILAPLESIVESTS